MSYPAVGAKADCDSWPSFSNAPKLKDSSSSSASSATRFRFIPPELHRSSTKPTTSPKRNRTTKRRIPKCTRVSRTQFFLLCSPNQQCEMTPTLISHELGSAKHSPKTSTPCGQKRMLQPLLLFDPQQTPFMRTTH